MQRIVGTALSLAALTAVLVPASAHAAPAPADSAGATISANTAANVNHAGTVVKWRLKVTCPVGENFEVWAQVDQVGDLEPLPAPFDGPEWVRWNKTSAFAGEGVPAVTGTCTGQTQKLRLALPVQPTRFDSAEYDEQYLFLPMHPVDAPDTRAEASLRSVAGTFATATFCAGTNPGAQVACGGGENGPRVDIV